MISIARMHPETVSDTTERSKNSLAEIAVRLAELSHPALLAWHARERVAANIVRWLEDAAIWPAVSVHSLESGPVVISGRHVSAGKNERVIEPGLLLRGRWSAKQIDALVVEARAILTGHDVSRLRAYVPHSDDRARRILGQHARIKPHKYVVAGRFGDLRREEGADAVPGLALVRPVNFAFYPEYAQMYERFNAAVPHLAEVVPVEPLERIQSFHQLGDLRLVMMHGEFAGLMAATPGCEFGCAGWCMRERILSQAFRGRGLGASVLRAFINLLPASDDDLLFGTIAHGNDPSLASAEKLGRVNIGGLYDFMIGRRE